MGILFKLLPFFSGMDLTIEAHRHWKDLYDFIKSLGIKVSQNPGAEDMPWNIVKSIQLAPNQYLYVNFAPNSKTVFVSPQVTPVAGYLPEEYNYQKQVAVIHPQDQPIMMEAIKYAYGQLYHKAVKPFETSFNFSYRLRHKNGHYLRVLRQGMPIKYSKDGFILFYVSVVTDISHLSNDKKVYAGRSGKGMEDYDFHVDKFYKSKFLSKREIDILIMLREGLHSSEIGERLFISKHTVDTHRRNILKKLGVPSTVQLIKKAQELNIL